MTDGGVVGVVIVTGATSLVGRYLLPLLMERRLRVQAISRRPPFGEVRTSDGLGFPDTLGPRSAPWLGPDANGSSNPPSEPEAGLVWRRLDLRGTPTAGQRSVLEGLAPATALIHTAPLWLLPAWLGGFAELGVQRLVAFSSTSRLTKEASDDSTERETARRLAKAEAAIGETCRSHRIRWTILRPTMIYGGGRDRNVSDIARWIRRLGFFPLAGEGRGLRQPVHAEDLAVACLSILDKDATFDRVYDCPGGETLRYGEMVSRVARGVGRRPRLVRLPLSLVRAILAVARCLPGYGHLTPEMADRMDEDLVFDASPARRDFGYAPRPFGFSDAPSDRAGCS